MKRKLLFIVPLPPPIAGPEISSRLLLESSLKDDYELIPLQLNVHQSNDQKGSVSLHAIFGVLRLLVRLTLLIIHTRPACVYTTLNQNLSGFVRDSLVVLVVKAFRINLVLHFRGSNFTAFHDRYGWFVRKYIRFILNLPNRIILQAHWLKERFRRYVAEEKLCVIYEGIATREFACLEEDGSKVEGETNVLFLNHLSVAKGFIDFLTTAKRIVQKRTDIHFFVAGDIINHERNILITDNGRSVPFVDISSALKSIANDESLSRQIHILGEITEQGEKLKLLGRSDIFVLPSYSEGCPLSVLEAMAAGLPVVVTRVGALTEIITEGRNGLFAEISDPEDLERQVLRLADNRALLRAMGETNRSLVRSQFDIGLVAAQVSGVFRSLLGAEAGLKIGVDTLFESHVTGTGGLVYLRNIVKALAEVGTGEQFYIFTSSTNAHLFEGLPDNIHLVRRGWSNERLLLRILSQQILIPLLARRLKLDVLLCPGNAVPLASGLPRVLVLMNRLLFDLPSEYGLIRRHYRRFLGKLSLKCAAKLIPLSHDLDHYLEEELGVARDRKVVLTAGVDLGMFMRPAARPRVPRRGSELLVVAELWPYKNHEVLLRALARCLEAPGFSSRLVFVGGDWKGRKASLLRLAKELGVDGRVTFLGHVQHDQMPAIYSRASILLYASLFECFPLPVLEAMASGVPVITSNRASFPELVGDAGLCLDPHDEAAWAEAIQHLLADSAFRADLIERGLRRAETYSWSGAAANLLAVLREAAQPARADRSGQPYTEHVTHPWS